MHALVKLFAALSIQRSREYLGNDRWRWPAWINGTQEDLDAAGRALYVLHPTFDNPAGRMNDRTTNSRLDTSGWGTFTVHAKVVHRDGRETPLERHPVPV